jgi:hypothetical protein
MIAVSDTPATAYLGGAYGVNELAGGEGGKLVF